MLLNDRGRFARNIGAVQISIQRYGLAQQQYIAAWYNAH